MDVEKKIQNLSNSDLLQICKEIYDWRYINGILCNGALSHFAKTINVNPRDLEAKLIKEANHRFNKVVSLLICDEPMAYFKLAH